jgi:multiple sugar transport system permease protein
MSLGYVTPTWILMIVVGVIPTGYAIWMSVTDQGLTAPSPDFVGFRNFAAAVFTPGFLNSLGVTALFVVVGLILQFVLGYLLATLIHRQLRGFKIARTVLLIPMLLTPVVVGLIWQFMLSPGLGAITTFADLFGAHLNVFADQWSARLVVVLIDSWMFIPFVMLMLSAGMTALPEEPIEAAAIDGAGWWHTTRYVLLPMLRPVIVITLLVRCVDAVRLFDIIFATTKGGPGTATQSVSMLTYTTTFQFYQFGYGAAMSIAVAVLMIPVYFLYIRLTRI